MKPIAKIPFHYNPLAERTTYVNATKVNRKGRIRWSYVYSGVILIYCFARFRPSFPRRVFFFPFFTI